MKNLVKLIEATKELDNTAELKVYTNNLIVTFCRENYETILIDGEIDEYGDNLGNKDLMNEIKKTIHSYGFIGNTALRNFTQGVLIDGIFDIENMKDAEIKKVMIHELSKEDAEEVIFINDEIGETAYVAVNKITGETEVYCSTENYLQNKSTPAIVDINKNYEEWNSVICEIPVFVG